MPPTPKYAPPRCPLGPVLWSPQPGSPYFSAICTRTDPSAICVLVFAENSKGGSPRSSVLHVDDPRFLKIDDKSGGVWDYTEDSKTLRSLGKSL